MIENEVRWVPVSETSAMLYLADEIDVSLAPLIGKICKRIETECEGVVELTPSYNSILIEANDFEGYQDDVLGITRQVIQTVSSESFSSGKIIELPVYYHPEVGPDLQVVAYKCGLSVNEVIHIHASTDYTVCAIGFAPGFAFLAEVDPRIAQPRHDRPRAEVSAGSVGIAGKQTAVYSADSPGGWKIIGNCPTSLYNPAGQPMCPFEVGDRVRFVPIDRETFIGKGGHV